MHISLDSLDIYQYKIPIKSKKNIYFENNSSDTVRSHNCCWNEWNNVDRTQWPFGVGLGLSIMQQSYTEIFHVPPSFLPMLQRHPQLCVGDQWTTYNTHTHTQKGSETTCTELLHDDGDRRHGACRRPASSDDSCTWSGDGGLHLQPMFSCSVAANPRAASTQLHVRESPVVDGTNTSIRWCEIHVIIIIIVIVTP